ncbi:MAG: hypothetical protein ACPLRP_06230 [Candidatus Bipolaricaulaceae bacterium]
MKEKVHVAFLWHMHQPWYLLPGGREAVLPWVRLRAAKDYYDMAHHLLRTGFPCTVNFTPSLTEQLRLLSAGKTSDPYTPDGPPWALGELQGGLIPMPLARRGLPLPPSFHSPEDFWAWFYLAWTAQTAVEEDPRLKAFPSTKAPGERLSLLLGMQKELVAEVLPLYRRLEDSGQIELSTTPFYHPILPLLIDSAVAKRARPGDDIPHFQAAADAEAQAARALAHHAEIFGGKPKGMWPAEGAVSPEALELLANLGVEWVATDGEILARTLGRPPRPEELYRPWRLRFGPQGIIVVFRDSFLSNLVSFAYEKWPWEKAVADLVGKIQAAVSHWSSAAPPLVLIALDGENAWDYYERNGRPFLLGLYCALLENFAPVKIGEYIARYGPAGELSTVWSGSWIDADFRTWIGEPQQNRAWQALAEVREAAEKVGDPKKKDEALAHIYVAEGSDWFWWRSSRNHTPLFSRFARIFRAHLGQAWRALGQEPPGELETL